MRKYLPVFGTIIFIAFMVFLDVYTTSLVINKYGLCGAVQEQSSIFWFFIIRGYSLQNTLIFCYVIGVLKNICLFFAGRLLHSMKFTSLMKIYHGSLIIVWVLAPINNYSFYLYGSFPEVIAKLVFVYLNGAIGAAALLTFIIWIVIVTDKKFRKKESLASENTIEEGEVMFYAECGVKL